MSNIHTLNHPLVDCHLSTLRCRETSSAGFRQSIAQLSQLLALHATQNLETKEFSIETPIQPTTGKRLSQSVGLIPILRAGISMVDPVLNLIPSSEVWHLGFYRDEETAQPVHYYSKLPEKPVDIAMILDPMLATGGSAVMAMEEVKAWGAKKIMMLSIIAAPEGLDHVQSKFPESEIFTCVIAQQLNENKFIVPGLGDAGDRIFNTQR